MLATFASALLQRDLLGGVERLLVGCSGGGDSTALLDLLSRHLESQPVVLAAIVVDHGVRSDSDSRADFELVRSQAESRGHECLIERAPSVERWNEAIGRQQRLTAFRRAAGRWQADAVAVGHTLDDQAETVLLQLARGAGPGGLAGIRPRRRLDGLLMLRPLLSFRRGDLRDYLRARGLLWREDPTNEDLSIARNRVRREVLPSLLEAVPGAVAAIARTANLLRDDETWLNTIVEQTTRALTVPEPHEGGSALDLAGLTALPVALQRRVLRGALRELRGDLSGISAAHVEAALAVADAAAGGPSAQDLPGVRVIRGNGSLRLLPLEARRLRATDGVS